MFYSPRPDSYKLRPETLREQLLRVWSNLKLSINGDGNSVVIEVQFEVVYIYIYIKCFDTGSGGFTEKRDTTREVNGQIRPWPGVSLPLVFSCFLSNPDLTPA